MTEIKFYRGLANKYRPESHSEGIYFAVDTRQIIHRGTAYGAVSDIELSDEYATKDFISDALCDYVKNLYFDEETGLFTYTKKMKVISETEAGEYITSYEDKLVRFSFKSIIGSIKNLSIKHSDGRAFLSYSKIIENDDKSLVEAEDAIEFPISSYSDGLYLDGLMTGADKEILDSHSESLKALNESITWNDVKSNSSLEEIN